MLDIIVVGNGLEAWLSCLYSIHRYPKSNITIVCDNNSPYKNIHTWSLATTDFLKFFNLFGIRLEDLMYNCGATVKNGTKYTNWVGDGKYYYITNDISPIHHRIYCEAIGCGIKLDTVTPLAVLSEQNEVLNINDNNLHLENEKVLIFLEKIAIRHNVKKNIGKVQDVERDHLGNIKHISLNTGESLKSSIIFNCTGEKQFFNNLPIKSLDDVFSTKRVFSFNLNLKDETVVPYTEKIAMKHGWMWKTPVADKMCCGYIFDSDSVSEEDAYKEICEMTETSPVIHQKCDFKQEYGTKTIDKNVISVGSSYCSIEPLIISEIDITLYLFNILPPFNFLNQHSMGINRMLEEFIYNCISMTRFKYLTQREDTNFWVLMNKKDNLPNFIHHIFHCVKMGDNGYIDNQNPFKLSHFIKCAEGINNLTLIPFISESNIKNIRHDYFLRRYDTYKFF